MILKGMNGSEERELPVSCYRRHVEVDVLMAAEEHPLAGLLIGHLERSQDSHLDGLYYPE